MADPGKSEILSDLITKFCDNLQPWQDDIVLLVSFHEDFEKWTLEDFRTAKRGALIKLRRTLRARGIWVESDSKKRLLPESLMDVLGQEEDDTFTWTEEEIEKLLRTGDKVISSKINNWLEKRQAATQPTQVKRPNSPSPSEASPSLADEPAMKKESSPVEQPAEKPVQQPPQNYTDEMKYGSDSDSELQYGLPPSFQTEEFLAHKLVLACRECPECRIACSDPPQLACRECPEYRIACSDPPQELSAMTQALPIMLKGIVLKYYYSTLLDRSRNQAATSPIRSPLSSSTSKTPRKGMG